MSGPYQPRSNNGVQPTAYGRGSYRALGITVRSRGATVSTDWKDVRTRVIAGLIVAVLMAIGGWIVGPFVKQAPETLYAQILAFLTEPVGISRGLAFLIAGAGIWVIAVLLLARGSDPSSNESEIAITAPEPNDHVAPPFNVSGRGKALPTGLELWVFTISSAGSRAKYWPHACCEIKDGAWAVSIAAKQWKPGDKRRFGAFLVGRNGQALIRHYFTAGEVLAPHGDPPWPAITTLTSDIVQCGSAREVYLQ